MKHNSTEVLEASKEMLKRLKIKYETIKVQEFKPNAKIEETGQIVNLWVVNYTYTVFEEESAFVYIDDTDLKLIYVLTKHGYITD
ncbi:inosine/xanthosine triphosphate pyrophosphatase family protein [Mucilaginibacter sp. UYNi724]